MRRAERGEPRREVAHRLARLQGDDVREVRVVGGRNTRTSGVVSSTSPMELNRTSKTDSTRPMYPRVARPRQPD
ncbi:MAG: hypothetical protein AUH68_05235 [Gemmatimonadetes bacterium 13_1_40CM_4_69_5]|nr:MAG: hypothetical protein AUH68_05235 [Gemmatimonadetes bacterium 13_1_40CM_4_69_5]